MLIFNRKRMLTLPAALPSRMMPTSMPDSGQLSAIRFRLFGFCFWQLRSFSLVMDVCVPCACKASGVRNPPLSQSTRVPCVVMKNALWLGFVVRYERDKVPRRASALSRHSHWMPACGCISYDHLM
jgi:hypothetical protein